MDQTLEKNIQENGIELVEDMPGDAPRRQAEAEPEISPELKKNISENGVKKGLNVLYEFFFSKARENYQKGDKEKAKRWANLLKKEEAYGEIQQLAEPLKLLMEGYLTILELEAGKNGYFEAKSRQIYGRVKELYKEMEDREKEGKIEGWEGEKEEREKSKKDLKEVIGLIESFYGKKEEMKKTEPREKVRIYQEPSEAEKLERRAEALFGKIEKGEQPWEELEGKLKRILGEAESYLLKSRLGKEEIYTLKGIVKKFGEYKEKYGQ